MRSALPVLLALSLAAVAFAADSDCAAPGKGRRWKTGKLVKIRVEERSEGGDSYGQLLRLTLTSGERTWLAQCAVGTVGCDPAGLDGGTSVRFRIEGPDDEQTLIVKRPNGRLLCARVAPPG